MTCIQDLYQAPIVASTLAGVVTTIGIVSVRHFENQAQRRSIYFIAFAAGVLVSVALLHIVPEAIARAAQAPFWILAGYLAMYLFNRFVCAFVCEQHSHVRYGLGLVPLAGIGLHSFVDGFVYSVTFSVSAFTGWLTAIGMVLHEFPEGIITYLLLVRGGFGRRASFWLAFGAAGLTTPLGTLLSYPVIRDVPTALLGSLLALSGGCFALRRGDAPAAPGRAGTTAVHFARACRWRVRRDRDRQCRLSSGWVPVVSGARRCVHRS